VGDIITIRRRKPLVSPNKKEDLEKKGGCVEIVSYSRRTQKWEEIKKPSVGNEMGPEGQRSAKKNTEGTGHRNTTEIGIRLESRTYLVHLRIVTGRGKKI